MQLGLSARGVGVAALLRQVVAKQGTRTLMAGVAPRITKRTLQVLRPKSRVTDSLSSKQCCLPCCQGAPHLCFVAVGAQSAIDLSTRATQASCR